MVNIDKEVKTSVAGMRKSINTLLKKNNIKYTYSLELSEAFCGEGFYINHNKRVNELKPIYGCDKNSAYMGALKNNIFPLSSDLSTSKESPLSIYHIVFTKIEDRYKDFYYTLYKNNIHVEKINGHWLMHLYLTHLDYEIFNDLYITDHQIISRKYFIDYGKLPLNDCIDKYYQLKKQDIKANKFKYEAGFYGMFAKLLDKKKEDQTPINALKQLKEVNAAMIYCGLPIYIKDKNGKEILNPLRKKLRDEQVPIAIFQTAYLRYEEWINFKKYQDSVVYMNTDSIYCNKPIDIETSKEIGKYKQEYNGETIFFIRRNAYIVIDDDFNPIKMTIGGISRNEDMDEEYRLDKEKIYKLWSGTPVICQTLDENHNKVEIELAPNFRLHKEDNNKIF